ncbi:MAG: RNA polymerase sigma factor [Minisyncoccia bacterium]
MHPADPDNIEEIIGRARLGDAEAFAALYTAYFTPLYRYIYFRVTDKSDVDDLTQEAFLKAYVSFPRYTHSGGSPLAYLYTIARHGVIDYYRKRKMPVADEGVLEGIRDDADTAEEAAIQRDENDMLRRCIAKLPQEQQDTVVLRFIEGFSTREIAVMLKKNETAVRQLQSRGLRALRKLLQTKEHIL